MSAVSRLLLYLIRGYQLSLSPWLGGHCRFYPSCSCYAHDAIERHGAWRGAWLGLRRLLRCHPLSAGGYDPVPGRE
jgi:putative membrane protein insertion efficiency factor